VASEDPQLGTLGRMLNYQRPGIEWPWDPEAHVERVLLHPKSDSATHAAVRAAIRILAPRLIEKVEQSEMTKAV
jgi:hypothetical protein